MYATHKHIDTYNEHVYTLSTYTDIRVHIRSLYAHTHTYIPTLTHTHTHTHTHACINISIQKLLIFSDECTQQTLTSDVDVTR